ncbi:NAD(P)H-dependent glycerol-3-phosphate dehydrogenase [Corynebacterium sp. zg254]|uniref:Glycerol-3-phosphate dehydrogenase [NAD(P)+] n=1 Tax=Corynebacterium zhongnanshanii TaxID=2768834 RepID=A0ABQ6VJH9_9CORY|nr:MULTISPECIES: NAD(P)H-dependent glycerol-3-phosphate dehydrogenase [Corynebacterium]KAB1553047.1 NAD(P)-dependent glycerol-3-phosphate dehydrogenase [Corynebacterium sp. 321]KAB1553732.1 NAD(P)-dependent glycerol-3-phosphate dehydrogenase [Corynebacterium sp. 319]KAB3523296.1 NAD(P)-dependent glycerol-3-phosphate dehydrogenase [Corynebacterium zhongnanshanii]KAB3540522.1 NAD(P)-dependent glycerol-3-phosphate dehydrogenase [Corynebacterium sp. 366]MCR5913583.1 NAD(P)H-dependent glycerol-3-ph
MQVAVMGAGSWGTTMAKVFADAGNQVRLWARRQEVSDEVNAQHTNSRYLGDITLPENLQASSDAEECLEQADIVVLGVPSQTLRDNLQQWRGHIGGAASVVSLAKGIEHSTGLRMSQVISDVADVEPERVAVLTGPNLAKEVAQGQPAATVVACVDEDRAKVIQSAAAAPYFRPYTNTDVIGCEIAGTSKNVIALGCGMAAGMGFGDNTAATVITRGLAETTRLALQLGADPRTLAGLAGMGDLVATCTSPLSRNRSFGVRMGKGDTPQQAAEATKGQVAEGVIASESIVALAAQHDVEVPIAEAVAAVCHHGMDVEDMVMSLLGRSRKSEL